MKIINLKNYGLVVSPPDEKAYVLGGLRSLPKIVRREDGQWGSYLPQYEPQFNENYDSSGCTVWGSQNCHEINLKEMTGAEYNFSERYNYILAGIRPPGADPQYVSEIFRIYGMIEDDWLPFTSTYEEFLKPDPMTTDLLAKGQSFPFEILHEWVWESPQTKDDRTAKMKECLRYSPLGASVTAWILDDATDTYIDNGMPNTHWVCIYGWNDKGWLVFDSYNHSHKILSYDHNIQMAKRYYLKKKEKDTPIKDTEIVKDTNKGQNWFVEIMANLLSFLSDIIKMIFKRQI